jgi:hypothetical protein
MTKHFILSLDPTAKYEWDRCTLRDPITAEHPALATLVAEAVGAPGSYLVSVNIEVTILEQASKPVAYSVDAQPNRTVGPVDLPSRVAVPQLAELVA